MKISTLGKVGLITLSALAVLAIIVSWKSELFLVSSGYKLTGSFKNIEGLTIGSEVRYRGFNVGKVMDIDPTPSDIKVFARVKRGLKIPTDSTLRIGFDGLVGLKYLEIRPGFSGQLYAEGDLLNGISTAGIVDFIDIGAQNLQETKAILENVRAIIEDPKLQLAFKNAVFTADKVTEDIRQLTEELRATNRGIMAITTDPKFQAAVKGTVAETHKTLSSANSFFESFGKLNVKVKGDVLFGNAANEVRGDIDIVQAPGDYLRFGLGEGAVQRSPGLLDVYLAKKVEKLWGLKLGIINSQLGGGLDIYGSPTWLLSTDVYDINNPKPNVPKVRIRSNHGVNPYVDLVVQADDLFNPTRNYSLGISIKNSAQ